MLSQKYKSVLDLGLELQIQNGDVKEENGVLKISGTAKTPYQKDLIWDKIKEVAGEKPTDIQASIDVEVDSYYHIHTVTKGESFWKIAEQYYKDGNKHPIISEHNNLEHIHPGDELTIPEFKKYVGGERLQVLLTALGHDTKGIDGKVGNNTLKALKEFQSANSLTATGELDESTKSSLRNAFKNSNAPLGGKALQILLRDAGFNPGTIDGIPGKNTAKAIANLQTAAGLSSTGELDADTQSILVGTYVA